MLRRLHPLAGMLGFAIILIFWLATAGSEIFGTTETIVAVKLAIPWGFLALVPALALTGASGFKLAGISAAPQITTKRRRMQIVAANGILVLMPSAFYLAFLASRPQLDGVFYGVQMLELAAGAINLTLMGLNMRDGLRLTGRLR